MKITLGTFEIVDALMMDKYAGWSYGAARAIAGHLEEYEEATGEELELDVVAIRCDYSEYESATEAAEEYGYTGDGDEDDAVYWLMDRTEVVQFDGGVIVRGF